MFRLVEIVKAASDGKESQACYPFNFEVDCKGEYETKLGQAMKSDLYSAFCYIFIDSDGDILGSAFYASSDEEVISPRLLEVRFVGDGEEREVQNLSKYSTMREAEANYHSKFGSDIKNSEVDGVMLCIIGERGEVSNLTYWVRPLEESNNSEEVVEE